MATPTVLDPCCGPRMWWFDRFNSDVVYGDCRAESLTVTDRSHGRLDGQRTVTIAPNLLLDFRALPFRTESFRLVAFDPPHLLRAGTQSWMAAKYGKLAREWRDDLRLAFSECFRVLAPGGVLVFKWNEVQVAVADVLALTLHQPLFGDTSRKRTHWMVFMKPSELTARFEGLSGGATMSGDTMPPAAREGEHTQEESHGPKEAQDA